MKMTVQAEQMKVCMLKSLLLRQDNKGGFRGAFVAKCLSSDLPYSSVNKDIRMFNNIKNYKQEYVAQHNSSVLNDIKYSD